MSPASYGNSSQDLIDTTINSLVSNRLETNKFVFFLIFWLFLFLFHKLFIESLINTIKPVDFY